MSLTDCVKSVGDSLDSQDVARIKELAAELAEGGQNTLSSQQNAGRAIIKELLGERETIGKQIADKGGVLAKRSEEDERDIPSEPDEKQPEITAEKGGPIGADESLLSQGRDVQVNKGEAPKTGLTEEEATKAVGQLMESFKADIDYVFINSDILAGIPRYSKNFHLIQGMNAGNRVVLVHDNIPDAETARITMLHEVIGHLGVNNVIGNKPGGWPELIGQYERMKKRGGKRFNKVHAEVQRRYAKDINGDIDLEVREFIAVATEFSAKDRQGSIENFLRKVFEKLVSALRKRGITYRFNMADIDILLGQSKEFIESEAQPEVEGSETLSKKQEDLEISDAAVSAEAESDTGYTSEEAAVIKMGFEKEIVKQSVNEKIASTTKIWRRKLRQGFVDNLDSFAYILNDKEAWMMGHLAKSSPQAVEAMIDHGQISADESGAIVVDTDTESLTEILEPLGEEVNRFLYWMIGHRAERLAAEERENLFDDKAIRVLKNLNAGEMKNGADRNAVYELARNSFEALHNSVVDLSVDMGTVNAEEAAIWKEEGFYIPFYRQIEEEENVRGTRSLGKGGLAKQQAFKMLKGGTSKLGNPLENILQNWSHLTSSAMKNQAAVRALETAEEMGFARVVNKKAKSQDAIYVRKEGREVWYEIAESQEGKQILGSLTSLNYDQMNQPWMKAGRKAKNILTSTVVVNPAFKIRNLIRDTLHAPAVSGLSVNIIKNVAKGLANTSSASEEYIQAKAGGGVFTESGYVNGADPAVIKKLVDKGVKRSTILTTKSALKKVIDTYQDVGGRAENINRMALKLDLKKKGATRLQQNFESRDLLDFTRTGSFQGARILAQTVPFLNARVQGLDKMVRAGDTAKFWGYLALYSSASVMMYMTMKDDDDYKELPDFERDMYHYFKVPGNDTLYRFPRPFEVGAVATMAERLAEQLIDDDVHGELFAERLGHALHATLNLNPTPQLIKPLMEVGFNTSWFTGRDIEPKFMQLSGMSSKEMKKSWTSETAIAMSEGMDKILWDEVVLSPLQIEFLVKGYFSFVGTQALELSDAAIRATTDAPSAPTKRVTDYPVAGIFVKEKPLRNTKFTSEFYDRLSKIRGVTADIKANKDSGDLEEAREIRDDNKGILQRKTRYMNANKSLAKINRKMKLINLSKKNPDEKRELIDKLTLRKNKITRTVVEGDKEFGR